MSGAFHGEPQLFRAKRKIFILKRRVLCLHCDAGTGVPFVLKICV